MLSANEKEEKFATNDKTYYQKTGFALSLILKVSVFGTRRWPIDNIFWSKITLKEVALQATAAEFGIRRA